MAGDTTQPAPSRAERIAFGASVLFLFVAPFAASGGTRAASLIVAALALAASGAWREAFARLPVAALASLAAWFALAVASLAWSMNPAYTLEELRAESFYGALAFVVFFVLASDANRWRPWWIAIIAGSLLAFVAKLLQQELGLALWRHAPDGGVGPFSTHLVVIAPLLIAVAWAPPWGFRRSPAVLACALLVLAAAAWMTREPWTTPNRIVWPALAAVFFTALLAGRKAGDSPRDSPPALRRVIAAAAIAIAIGFLASIAAKSERFYPKDASLAASVEHDLRPRLWALGWEKWKEAPWLGAGFGREILADTFVPETPAGVQHPIIRHSHNALLNIALQLGLVGLALFVFVLAAFAREYVAMLPAPSSALLGVMGLALIAGFVTKNLTDDFLHRHNAQVFWALNGMLLGLGARRRGG